MQANEVEDVTVRNENDTNSVNDGNLGPGPNHHEEDLQRDYYLSLGARPKEYNGATAATTGYELKNMDGVKLHSI